MLRHLTDVGANIVGAIINDVDVSKHPYFSNYYHQYHYSYSHGKLGMTEGEKTAGW